MGCRIVFKNSKFCNTDSNIVNRTEKIIAGGMHELKKMKLCGFTFGRVE
jgi:hypothetical protein